MSSQHSLPVWLVVAGMIVAAFGSGMVVILKIPQIAPSFGYEAFPRGAYVPKEQLAACVAGRDELQADCLKRSEVDARYVPKQEVAAEYVPKDKCDVLVESAKRDALAKAEMKAAPGVTAESGPMRVANVDQHGPRADDPGRAPGANITSPRQTTIEASDLLFEIRRCHGSGDELQCDFTMTNKAEDRDVHLGGETRIIDAEGTEFRDASLSLGGTGAGRMRMPKGVPIKASATFHRTSSRTPPLRIFEVQAYASGWFRVTFHDVPVD